MIKHVKNALKAILYVCCFAISIKFYGKQEEKCFYFSKNEQIALRHIEGKGIGYDQGYTTIQLFVAPYISHFIPMLDLRGHVFDDGRFAANAGVGLRHMNPARINGINAYYDYRQTRLMHFNQLTLGGESLGKWVDFRLSGYIPMGRKSISLEHNSQKRERILKGANAEAGIHMVKKKQMLVYGALGPYYFGARATNVWGGEARIAITFFEHVCIELSGSYDSLFKAIGQGQLSLIYFFGPKGELKTVDRRPCADTTVLRDRAAQWIERFEIIVLDKID